LKKKYLTVLAGNPRGGDDTFKSLNKYVLENLDSDLAICTGDKWPISNYLLNISTYKWIFKEPNNWFDYYEENYSGYWKEFFNLGKKTGLYNSGNIHFAIKDIILKNYLDSISQYDYIIYSRFDQFYTDYHIDIKDSESIWIPSGENYGGICDRHAIVPLKYIESFLNICEYIDKKQAISNPPKYLNCETAFLRHLNYLNLYKNVSRFNRSQFTASLVSDKTNWRVGKYKVYGYKKLMMKYPDEFIESIRNSIKVKGSKYIFQEFKLYLNYIYLNFRRKFGLIKKLFKLKL